MISIRKDGQPFDLGNIQMTFRLRSPLWNDIPSHTFSFDLDATDRNLKLTGYLHRPTTRQTQPTDIPVQCNIHGWILGAILRVETATEKKIKCYLAIDNGQMNVDWGDEYLDEIDFPVINRSGGVSQIMTYNKDKTSDEVECQFPPVRIPEFFDDEEPEDAYQYTGWINYYDPETPEYAWPFVHNTTGKVYVPTISIPMFYARWIVRTIMRLKGITFNPSFLSSGPLKELLVFNNRVAEEKRKRYYFRATRTTAGTFTGNQMLVFDDETTTPNTDPENVYNNITQGVMEVKETGIHDILVYVHVTSMTGVYNYLVIDNSPYDLHRGDNYVRYSALRSAGHQISVYLYAYHIHNSVNIDDDITISAGAYIAGKNASLSDLPKLYDDGYVDTKLHMPHIKIKEFLSWFKDGFGLVPIFNSGNRELKFVYMNDVLKKPATRQLGNLETESEHSPDVLNGINYQFSVSGDDAPLTDEITGLKFLGNFASEYELPLPQDSSYYAYVVSVGKYYLYSWDETYEKYTWKVKTDYLKELTTGKGESDINPAWHPPANFYEGDIFGASPFVKCKGSSQFFKVGINETPLMMMLYHGMQKSALTDGTTPYTFPLASGLRYNTYGEEIGELELKWDGEKGLRKTFWLALEEFYASRWGLKGKKQIDAVWLRQLSWEEGYLHKGREYLMDTVEFTVTQLGFSAATITAWRKP